MTLVHVKLVSLVFIFGVTAEAVAARTAPAGASHGGTGHVTPSRTSVAHVSAFRGTRRVVARSRTRVPFVAAGVVLAPYYVPPAPYITSYYTPVYPEPHIAPYGEPIDIERTPSSVAPEQQAAYSSYFCPSSKAYYPQVRSCPEGWQQAAPDPAGAFLNTLRAQQ